MGSSLHSHQPKDSEETKIVVEKMIKELSLNNKYVSASVIVQDVLVEKLKTDKPMKDFPTVNTLVSNNNHCYY